MQQSSINMLRFPPLSLYEDISVCSYSSRRGFPGLLTAIGGGDTKEKLEDALGNWKSIQQMAMHYSAQDERLSFVPKRLVQVANSTGVRRGGHEGFVRVARGFKRADCGCAAAGGILKSAGGDPRSDDKHIIVGGKACAFPTHMRLRIPAGILRVGDICFSDGSNLCV